MWIALVNLSVRFSFDRIEEKWKTDLELKDTILEIADDLISGCEMDAYDASSDPKWKAKYIYMYNGQDTDSRINNNQNTCIF